MYNVVNKRFTLNYLSTQCRVHFRVQCTMQKSVNYSAKYFKGDKEQYLARNIYSTVESTIRR